MPKKSKKAKIIADQRRQQQAQPIVAGSSFEFTFSSPVARAQSTAPQGDGKELHAIRRDLIKTMALAACAIGVEFALFWFTKGNI